MKKQFTLGNALAIFVPIIILLLAWGNTVEVQLKEHGVRIELVEKSNEKIEEKLDRIQQTTTDILIELQNKKNRED